MTSQRKAQVLCLYIIMEVLGRMSAFVLLLLLQLNPIKSVRCKFREGVDIGFRNGSSVVGYKLGTFTQDECCSMCLSNHKCVAAALLDKTHGSHEGCWLQNGANLVPRNAPGVTLCDSQRKDIPSIERVDLKILDLDKHPYAKCMDGSPAGYYFASNSSSKSWIIELQGGGECASAKLCDSRVGTPLFSSKYFPRTVVFDFLNSQQNPKLNSFNRVFLPYCSQDLWTGQRKTNNEDTFGYFFSGHLILEAVLNELESLSDIKNAEEIILTGESAGGIGVFPNVDFLADAYPRARVVAAPIAGFYFFAYPYTGPGHTSSELADFRKSAWPSHYSLWQSFVDVTCSKHLPEPAYCILANYTLPFVESEAFIVESQTDKVVLLYHDWIPTNQDPNWSASVKEYFTEWQHNMSIALQSSSSDYSKNGVFSPACFIHTGFSIQSPLINGLNFVEAFSKWFFDGESIKLQDDCGILCNPSCPH